MHQKLKRALAMTTAIAAVGSVSLITSNIASAAAGDPAIPGLALTVQSGTNLTTFAMTLPANNGCPGNGAADGYRWQQYLVSAAVNPGTLTYNASGPVLPAGAPVGSIAQPMFNTTGSPQINKTNIGAAAPYTISGTSTLNLDINRQSGLINGEYKIGFACSKAGVTEKFWEAPITITNAPTAVAASLNYAYGVVPAAPTVTASGADSAISGSVAAPATPATPAITGYTITATPTIAGAPVSVTVAAAGSYTISGLTNGTSYNVTAVATNLVGNSLPASAPNNPVLVSLPDVAPAPVVVAENSASPATISWTPSTGTPAGGATLVSHTVTFVPVAAAAPIAPITVLASDPNPNEVTVTGVVGDFYTVSVVGTYSNGQVTAAGIDTFGFVSERVIVQDITVTRPTGALVLTQRCGVYGSAIAYSDNVFGSLPLLPAVPANADPDNNNGTAADATDDFYDTLPGGSAPKNDSLPFNPNAGVTTDDSLFPQYPYPVDANGDSIATYPTNCGITLDTPRLITSGPKAGQYFRTTGRIAQLTVVNTQNIDGGWTLNGTMGNFSNGTDSFSGNLMGWDPEVTWDSLANLDGYDMTATAGGRRQPEATASTTGLGAASNATNTVLASSLAKSEAGDSLGMAVMDARLRLLVPVAADSGVYKGALTFTIV